MNINLLGVILVRAVDDVNNALNWVILPTMFYVPPDTTDIFKGFV